MSQAKKRWGCRAPCGGPVGVADVPSRVASADAGARAAHRFGGGRGVRRVGGLQRRSLARWRVWFGRPTHRPARQRPQDTRSRSHFAPGIVRRHRCDWPSRRRRSGVGRNARPSDARPAGPLRRSDAGAEAGPLSGAGRRGRAHGWGGAITQHPGRRVAQPRGRGSNGGRPGREPGQVERRVRPPGAVARCSTPVGDRPLVRLPGLIEGQTAERCKLLRPAPRTEREGDRCRPRACAVDIGPASHLPRRGGRLRGHRAAQAPPTRHARRDRGDRKASSPRGAHQRRGGRRHRRRRRNGHGPRWVDCARATTRVRRRPSDRSLRRAVVAARRGRAARRDHRYRGRVVAGKGISADSRHRGPFQPGRPDRNLRIAQRLPR